MEKIETYETVSISPQDFDVKVLADAVRIYNDFKVKGFDTREKFVNAVMEHVDGLSYFEGMTAHASVQRLYTFWQLRLRDAAINVALDNILEHLKSE